jgi:hypothetical protein
MVAGLTAWAREQDLTGAELTILTIEPPPRESYPRTQRRRYFTQTSGFIFSVIHLDESKSVPSDMRPVPDSDQVLHLVLPAAAGDGARALIPPNVPAGAT